MVIVASLTYSGNQINFSIQGLPDLVARIMCECIGRQGALVIVQESNLVVLFRMRFILQQRPWTEHVMSRVLFNDEYRKVAM